MHGDNYTFTGNTIRGCDNACAYFSNIENVTITGNVFDLACQAPDGLILASSLGFGGIGYVVGDVLVPFAGNLDARVTVDSVSAGVVTSYHLSAFGTGYIVANGIGCGGGSGSGFLLNINTVAPADVGNLVITTFSAGQGTPPCPPQNLTITGNVMSGADGRGYCAIEFVNFWFPDQIYFVNQAFQIFVVANDFTTEFNTTGRAVVTDSFGNDGIYTVTNAYFEAGYTNIVVAEPIPDDGTTGPNGNISGATSNDRKQTHINCSQNNFGLASRWRSPDPMVFYPDKDSIIGAEFIHRNNVGNTDCDPKCGTEGIPTPFSGDITVTGIPFRPRTIQIDAGVLSASLISRCQGCVEIDLTFISNSSASDSSGFFSTHGTGLKLYDGLGNLVIDADVTAFTNDGFIITVNSTTSEAAFVNFTANP
jgi:hypothetical protein